MSNNLKVNLTLTADGKLLISETGRSEKAIKGLGTEAKATDGHAKKLGQTLKNVGSIAAGAFAISGFAGFAGELVSTVRKVQDLEIRIRGLSKSAKDYANIEQFLTDLSEKHHKSLLTLSGSFASLLTLEKAGLITRKQSKELLIGLSNAASETGASNEQLKQSMYGLSQALGTGVVHMEELNQVTEPMPGLLNNIADAAGYTVGEFRHLVAQGKITSEQFGSLMVKAFDAYSGAAERAGDTITAKYADIENAWTNLAKTVERPVAEAMTPALNGVAEALNFVSENAESFKKIGEGLVVFMAGRAITALQQYGAAQLSAAANAERERAASIAAASALKYKIQQAHMAAEQEQRLAQISLNSAQTIARVTNNTTRLTIAREKLAAANEKVELTSIALTAAEERLTLATRAQESAMARLNSAFSLWLAWDIGTTIGEWLNQFEIARAAGIRLAEGFTLLTEAAGYFLTGEFLNGSTSLSERLSDIIQIYDDIAAHANDAGQKQAESANKAAQAVSNQAEASHDLANEKHILASETKKLTEAEKAYKQIASENIAAIAAENASHEKRLANLRALLQQRIITEKEYQDEVAALTAEHNAQLEAQEQQHQAVMEEMRNYQARLEKFNAQLKAMNVSARMANAQRENIEIEHQQRLAQIQAKWEVKQESGLKKHTAKLLAQEKESYLKRREALRVALDNNLITQEQYDKRVEVAVKLHEQHIESIRKSAAQSYINDLLGIESTASTVAQNIASSMAGAAQAMAGSFQAAAAQSTQALQSVSVPQMPQQITRGTTIESPYYDGRNREVIGYYNPGGFALDVPIWNEPRVRSTGGGQPTTYYNSREYTDENGNVIGYYHSGGIVGKDLGSREVATTLRQDEGVFTENQMKALAPVKSLERAIAAAIKQHGTGAKANAGMDDFLAEYARINAKHVENFEIAAIRFNDRFAASIEKMPRPTISTAPARTTTSLPQYRPQTTATQFAQYRNDRNRDGYAQKNNKQLDDLIAEIQNAIITQKQNVEATKQYLEYNKSSLNKLGIGGNSRQSRENISRIIKQNQSVIDAQQARLDSLKNELKIAKSAKNSGSINDEIIDLIKKLNAANNKLSTAKMNYDAARTALKNSEKNFTWAWQDAIVQRNAKKANEELVSAKIKQAELESKLKLSITRMAGANTSLNAPQNTPQTAPQSITYGGLQPLQNFTREHENAQNDIRKTATKTNDKIKNSTVTLWTEAKKQVDGFQQNFRATMTTIVDIYQNAAQEISQQPITIDTQTTGALPEEAQPVTPGQPAPQPTQINTQQPEQTRSGQSAQQPKTRQHGDRLGESGWTWDKFREQWTWNPGSGFFHAGGIVGKDKSNREVATTLYKGEGVFTPNQMAALAPVSMLAQLMKPAGGSNVQVHVHEAPNTQTEVKQTQQPDGSLRIDVIAHAVEQKLAAQIRQGTGLGRTLTQQYGLRRAV